MADTDTIKIRLTADPGNVETAAGQAEKAIGRLGQTAQVSAAQTAAAMRSLPAQFTDIATQLQGGQSPVTVLLQQGGQIKDQFGSIGAAVRGVGGYIGTLVTPLTAVGAALALTALAYAKGSAEADKYNQALVLSGNAAGTTAGRLADAARRVSTSVGTQAAAAEALAQLAGAANINPAGLERFAEAAVRMERAVGAPVADTIKQFSELGKSPVDAAVKLNESTNFLTASVYRQIKALEDSGKTAEAGRVAQEAYADALVQRSQQIEARLGLIELAWRGVKDGAGAAWDAMLNVGRGQTLEEKIKEAEQQIRNLQGQTGRIRGQDGGGLLGSFFAGRNDEKVAENQAFIDTARESLRLESRVAAAAKATADQVKARVAFDKLVEGSLTEQEKLSRAIAQANALADASGASAIERAQVIAALREKFKPKEGADPFAAERAAAKGWADAVGDFARIAASATAKSDELTDGQRRLVEYLQSPAYQRASEPMRELALQQAYAAISAEQHAAAQRAVAKVIDEAHQAYAKQLQTWERGVDAIQQQVDKLELESQAAELAARKNITLADAIAEVEIARLRELQTASLGDENRVLVIEREIQARQRLRDALNTKAQRESADKLRRDQAAEWQRTWDQVSQGLADALTHGGKAGVDYIVRTLKAALINSGIQAAMAAIFGSSGGGGGSSLSTLAMAYATSSGSGGSAGMGAGGAWGGSSGSSSYASVQQAAQWAQLAKAYGGSSATASQFVAGYQGSSANLGAGMAGPVTDGASGATGTGASSAGWGTTAVWVAAAIAGAIKANQDYSAGYDKRGSRNVGEEQRRYGGPLGTWEELSYGLFRTLGVGERWSNLLSGTTAVARLFGRAAPQITDSGVQGTFGGASGADLMQYANIYEKGSYLSLAKRSKDYQVTAALDAEVTRGLGGAVQGIQDQVRGYLQALGLVTDGVDGYTQAIHLSLAGLDTKAQQAAITKALAGFGDGLIEAMSGPIEGLRREGETAGDAMQRLVGNLSAVNTQLDLLGLTALNASVSSADAAQQLIDAFGGLDKLGSKTQAYFDNYYSDSERAAAQTRLLSKQLADVGLQLPETRAGFRALVDAQDLTTAEGRKAYTTLLGVSDAFAQLHQTMTLSVVGVLDEIKRLRSAQGGPTDGAGGMAALQQQFATLTAQARAGSQSALDELPSVSQAIEAASKATARSAADVASMRAYLLRSLSDTSSLLADGATAAAGGAGSSGGVPAITATPATGLAAGSGAAIATQQQQGADMVRELQALRSALDGLRADQQVQAAQLATNTGKVARLLDRVAQGGDAINTRIVT